MYADPIAERVLVSMNRDPEEQRSFHFFRNITAPSFAGALVDDFWLQELPRLCHEDLAIWHAVVCLGSTSEYCTSGTGADPTKNYFALKQLNASIRSINASASRALWWRALVVSAIYTSVCIFQKDYATAAFHFFHGYRLLQENSPEPEGTESPVDKTPSPRVPVSIAAVRSLMSDVVARGQQFDTQDFSETPPLLPADSSVTLWESYVAPPGILPTQTVDITQHVRRATKASESLFWALHFYSMRRNKSLRGLFVKRGPEHLADFVVDQEPYVRCYREIRKAVASFSENKEIRITRPKIMTKERTELKKTWLSLQLLHASCKAFFLQDPDLPNSSRRQQDFASLYRDIVDLAEQIIKLAEKSDSIRSPNPTVSNPLFLVVRSAYEPAVRQRAMKLLKQPRVESLWDSRIGALFSEEIMQREMCMTEEYDERGEDRSIVIDDFTSRGREVEVRNDSSIHPLARICSFKWEKLEGDAVRLKLFTWREWLHSEPGKTVDIGW